MKKLILITSCVVLFAATSFAQTDTTKVQDKTKQSSDQIRSTDHQDMKGWTRVETANIPANLRTTLNDAQYKGWETGTLYTNEAGDMYTLKTTGATPKMYYFDKNGKAVKKPNN